jgi:hypothetical protein
MLPTRHVGTEIYVTTFTRPFSELRERPLSVHRHQWLTLGRTHPVQEQLPIATGHSLRLSTAATVSALSNIMGSEQQRTLASSMQATIHAVTWIEFTVYAAVTTAQRRCVLVTAVTNTE